MKRLSDRLRIHYNMTADDIAEEAADRIEALEECLREVMKHGKMAVDVRYDYGQFSAACKKARALLEEK